MNISWKMSENDFRLVSYVKFFFQQNDRLTEVDISKSAHVPKYRFSKKAKRPCFQSSVNLTEGFCEKRQFLEIFKRHVQTIDQNFSQTTFQ